MSRISKKWKVAIGVIVVAVVVSVIGLLKLGRMLYWNSDGKYGWNPAVYISELVWGTGASTYLPEFGWDSVAHMGQAEWTTEWKVRLVDDDEDGVPDRGVIEAPTAAVFDQGFGLGHDWHFGSRHGGRVFSPFRIVGGMALFALLIGLGVIFFRRWSGTRPAQA
jgi:hypothetical protein